MTNVRMMVGALLLTGCPATLQVDLLENGGFDAWCDDAPCGWMVLEGTVRQVETWHALDFGASLEGSGAAIEQVYQGWYDGCVELEVLRDGNAVVRVELDYFDDDVVDASFDLPGGSWERSVQSIPLPFYTDAISVTVRAATEGSVVLGHVHLRPSVDRFGEPLDCQDRVEIPLGLGYPCDTDGGCSEGTCEPLQLTPRPKVREPWAAWPTTCSACETDADCGTDEVCGVDGGTGPYLARTCVPAGTDHLGQACVLAQECETGICSEGVCAECGLEVGGACECSREFAGPDPNQVLVAPVCVGSERALGDTCVLDRQCASDRCEGSALRRCFEHAGACDRDTDCPGGLCLEVGVLDGQCG